MNFSKAYVMHRNGDNLQHRRKHPGKKELWWQWKQGLVSWEEYRDAALMSRDEVRKARAHLEMNFRRNVKNNKKASTGMSVLKRKVEENIPSLKSKNGELVAVDEKKSKVLNKFFTSVFTDNLLTSQS